MEESGFQLIATLVVTGVILGIAQSLIIRRDRLRWIIASSIGWFLGIQARIITAGLTAAIVKVLLSIGGLWEVFWLNLASEPVTSGVLGIAQWLILRSRIPNASWWIIANIIGGAARGATSSAVCAIACQGLAPDRWCDRQRYRLGCS